MSPETRYAKSGEVFIAYQVTGQGPDTLVYTPGTVSHLDLVSMTAESGPWFFAE